jgi:SAM-dependent methyltransferase
MHFEYAGSELELFAHATNWKRYWAGKVGPYVGGDVLEVGAGIGSTARLFPWAEVRSWTAIEPDGRLVEQIDRSACEGGFPRGFRSMAATVADLPVAEAFDVALYVDVLEHIEDDSAELLRVARLLRPGGCIVVMGPAHPFLFTAFDSAIGHFRRYNRAMLTALTPTGWVLEDIRYLDSVGMLASAGNRFLLRSNAPTRRQIALWDRVFVPASRVVDKLTGHRLGKSILAVYRKPEREH